MPQVGGGGRGWGWGGGINSARGFMKEGQICVFLSVLISPTAFAVTPFLGDITPFSKPGRRFGNYVASLGRSFTVVNIVGSRPAFRVSSVVIRSVFTHGLSIQT